MSTAAARLGLSQSAVSQTIRNLENQVGAILVNRQDRPISLTPAGSEMAHRGALLLDGMIDLGNAVADLAKGVNPNIHLGIVDSFAATCGGRLARALAARTTRLAVRTGLTPSLEQQLLKRELDLIISSEAGSDTPAIKRYELFRESFLAITPKAKHASQACVQDLRELAAGLPLIRYNLDSHLGMQLEEVVQRHQIKSPPLLEFDTADTLTSMVSEGLGWALTTPLCALQAEHYAERIDYAFIGDLQGVRSLYLAARSDQHEGFVEDALEICRELIRTDLIPRLRQIHPRLADCVTPSAQAPA